MASFVHPSHHYSNGRQPCRASYPIYPGLPPYVRPAGAGHDHKTEHESTADELGAGDAETGSADETEAIEEAQSTVEAQPTAEYQPAAEAQPAAESKPRRTKKQPVERRDQPKRAVKKERLGAPPAAKKPAKVVNTAVAGTKRPRSDDPDEAFRDDAQQQFKKLKPTKGSNRADEIATILPFLNVMEFLPNDSMQTDVVAAIANTGDAPDAFLLDSASAAKLLRSKILLTEPVFVTNGARDLFDDDDENQDGEKRRPIEIALNDWFLENDRYLMEGRRAEDVRKHFTASNGQVEEPWNLPDIVNPMVHRSIPDFLQSVNCNFLRDVVMDAQDWEDDEICQDDCPHRSNMGACCNEHHITFREFNGLQNMWSHWRSTLMIADAGATTHGHWDKFGLGTWIACHEGEIGFCWQSHPENDKQRGTWRQNDKKVAGTYLYRVVRAGQALYMPPGTVHHVFRLPEGKQTLATAGHILQRNAVPEWLKILQLDVSFRAKTKKAIMQELAYVHCVPPFLRSVKVMLEAVANGTDRAKQMFGGEKRISEALGLIPAIEKDLLKIQNMVKKDVIL